MIILTRAPFLVILAGLTAALAADGSVVWAIPPIALVVVLGTMLVSFRVTLRGQRSVAAAVLIVALCCSSWVAFSLSRRPVLPSFVQAEGVVVESRPWGRLYAVSVNTKEGGFLLKLPFGELVEGQRVRVEGTPKPFKGTVSGGSASGSDFREDRFWYARGMTAQLTSARFEPLRQSGGLRDWSVHRWRYGLFRSLTLHMPSLTGAYLNAAWTGKRDKDLNEKHKLFGTSHLLAVSGFHVGLLMLGASLVFRRGGSRVPCLSLLLWFSVLSTGASASAARAGAMIQVALFGELVGRPGSAINSVSLAAVLLLLHSPFRFWDVGWRLSVLAALVIAAVLERGKPGDRHIWLFISPMIWIATFPQVAWTFDSVPVAGIFINFFAPALFGVILSFASAFALLRLAGVPGMGFFLWIVEKTLVIWESAADGFAHLLPWQLSWNPLFVHCCAAALIVLLCRALFVPWRNVALLAPLGSLAAFLLFTS